MTLNVGLIGTGAIGTEHFHRINDKLSDAQVVAVCDVNKDQAMAVAKSSKTDVVVFDSGQELIKSPTVDAVIVASWGPTHEEYVLACIEAGKPVFCEKPLAVTAAGCRKIVDAELAAGRKFVQVGFMRRYDESYRQLKQTLNNNVIGAPLILNCAHRAPEAPGFKGDMAITDSLVHEMDVLRWLLEDDYVSAQVIQPRRSSLSEEGLQDPHIIQLRTKQGIHISVESFVFCQYGYDIQCQVVGEKGIASLAEPSNVLVRTEAKLYREILMDWKLRFSAAFDAEFQDWIDSTLKGEVNGPTAWDGYVVSITADACVKAKYSGQIEPIEIPARPDMYK